MFIICHLPFLLARTPTLALPRSTGGGDKGAVANRRGLACPIQRKIPRHRVGGVRSGVSSEPEPEGDFVSRPRFTRSRGGRAGAARPPPRPPVPSRRPARGQGSAVA